ncbi:MAG: protein translocase subunit SecD [Planctomycetota bacterium]|nr:MAG: protein translocase subunit SecD [Planctomycetota bacterium]
MQHLVRNTLIVILILALCGVSIFPPEKTLRRGRDLAGGVSLIYSVEVAPGEDESQVIDSTIEVLKERVDPNGLFEISFVRQGRNRIEVTMPLPTDRVRQLRETFEAELARLDDLAITSDDLDRALRMAPDDRAREIERLAGGDEQRLALLTAAAEAQDAARQARAAYEEAVESGAEQAVLEELLSAAGAAVAAADEARDAVLAAAVDPADVRLALELSDQEKKIPDGQGGVTVVPSPRDRALERLKTDHPAAAEQIDRVVRAFEAYRAESRGLDDPADLIRLLQGAGVLTFRIAVSPDEIPNEQEMRAVLAEQGPRASTGQPMRWFEIDDISTWYSSADQQRALEADPAGYFRGRELIGAERDGVYYLLLHDDPSLRMTPAEGNWSIASAFRTVDELGRPAVGFQMDAVGANLLGRLTGANIDKPMAVLLDDKVYSAPNLLGRISSNGIIQGEFSSQEITYLVRTLNAGSLQAKLSPQPLSMNVIGPQLGADNVRQGFTASVVALVAVAAFMVFYYFGSGLIAVIALLSNAVIILGIMALARAAFTLPGIAGVVLTFGMAVDANVLIYERIREELDAGADLRTAVRLGYQKVVSTIMDANITNLIVCGVLYAVATQEVKGFAVTLGIGIVATLFSALFITRLVFTLLLEKVGVRRMPQLPMVVPAIQRLLSPNVNWLRLRPAFLVISTAYVGLGLFMIYHQREEMLDTEFRGGTAITVRLKAEDPDGPGGRPPTQLVRARQEIEDLIHPIGESADPGSPLAPLRNAEIIPVNPQADGVTSDQFIIKTTATEQRAVVDSIVRSLADLIDTRPPLRFDGMDAEDLAQAPVYRIVDGRLGENIGRPEVRTDVADFVGGVAIVFGNLDPPPTLQNIERRLEQMRAQADFADLLGRPNRVIVIDGSPERVQTAAVVVLDPEVTLFDDPGRWRTEVAEPEWRLARAALTETTTLAGVQSFSPAIAQTFKAKAVVAVLLSFLGIGLYIWIRFGSLRYSLAAVVALVHDVLTTVGLIAIAEVIYEQAPGLAAALLIEPFKINLGLIAALLTIIGYSLNDTIVILDRIRENRGKLAYASASVVNTSINQTISRTVITSGTTLIAVLIMYMLGGPGIRDFTYALICGVVVGTYSSIAVAAPLVYSKKKPPMAHRADGAAIAKAGAPVGAA